MTINKIYAFVSIEDDGTEGVCAVYSNSENCWMPLITGNEKNIKAMTVMAEVVKKKSKETIRLVEFSTRTVIKTL